MKILRLEIVTKRMSATCADCTKGFEVGSYRLRTSNVVGQKTNVFHVECVQKFLDTIDFYHCDHRHSKHSNFYNQDTPCSEEGCDCKKFKSMAIPKGKS